MVKITKSNIESEAHNNIITVIDNRTNIKDPRHPTGYNGRVFVTDSDPLEQGINFNSYPYVYIEPPVVEYSRVSSDGKKKITTWKSTIIIRTSRDGASNTSTSTRQVTGMTDVLTMGDSLNEAFNNETVKASLRVLNMYDMKLTKNNTDTLMINNKPVYVSEYELEYNTRLEVSS